MSSAKMPRDFARPRRISPRFDITGGSLLSRGPSAHYALHTHRMSMSQVISISMSMCCVTTRPKIIMGSIWKMRCLGNSVFTVVYKGGVGAAAAGSQAIVHTTVVTDRRYTRHAFLLSPCVLSKVSSSSAGTSLITEPTTRIIVPARMLPFHVRGGGCKRSPCSARIAS